MHSVETTDEFYEGIRKGKPLLACFQAEWCGDCHYLKPSYVELEARFSGEVDFVQVDIDNLPEIARAHEVSGIPSFILFSSGRETFRLVNPRRKTKEEVTDFLEKGLALIPRSKENS
jgi:thioredoxin-like negative regulator of GroEL